MATVTRSTVWSDAQVLTAAALNGEFNNLLNALAIVNADISAGAAIDISKISGGVDLNSAQELTNKTLDKPILKGSVMGVSSYTPGAGATATLDCSNAQVHVITMPAGNITIALSNITTNQAFVVKIIQDSVGSRTVTWFTTIKWPGGSEPILITTALKQDVFGFLCTGSNTYDGFILGTNM